MKGHGEHRGGTKTACAPIHIVAIAVAHHYVKR